MKSDSGAQTIITCSGGKGDQLRAIIEYKEEVCVYTDCCGKRSQIVNSIHSLGWELLDSN